MQSFTIIIFKRNPPPLPENLFFFFSVSKLIQSEIRKLSKYSLKYVRNTLERLLPARSLGKNYLNHVLPGLGIFFLFYLFFRPLSEAEMQKITTETQMPFVSRQGSADSLSLGKRWKLL